MATIDLEKLRAIQSYFVPIKKQKLRESILKELNGFWPFVLDMAPWAWEEHGNSMTFFQHNEFMYLLGRLKRDYADIKKDAQKLHAEFVKLDPIKSIEQAYKYTRINTPSDIYVNIRRCEENGCEIEVECTPILYRWISQLAKRDVDDCQIQDAYINCKRFLETIFVGGLNGAPLSEKKVTFGKISSELLINDISRHDITEKLEEMLDNATTEVLICGWIGTIFMTKIRKLHEKKVKIRVITGFTKAIRQDEMRKEKERAMRELISIIGKNNISCKPEFHGRAVIVDNRALIGSMDLDSYSMTGARIEFASYIENPEVIRTLRSYFEQIFVPWKEDIEEQSKN